jgi:hypothetical protein
MIVIHPPFLYHLLYTTFVMVSYFHRIFIAILLLDIFIRIPLLSTFYIYVRTHPHVNLATKSRNHHNYSRLHPL